MTKHFSFSAALLLAVAFLSGSPAVAQDVVALHSVTIHTNTDVTVVYSKNFATCAHLRFNNDTCTQFGPLTHVQNIFCTQGNMVSVTVPSTAFVAGFDHGIPVYMVHGNNPNVNSACLHVVCDGIYGAGCAGVTGIPSLTAIDACSPWGGTLDFTIGNGPPGSLAVLGLGLAQIVFPLFGCDLLIGPVQVTALVPLNGSGVGTLSLLLPPGSGSFTFTMQAYVLDAAGPQGFSATNGVLVEIH